MHDGDFHHDRLHLGMSRADELLGAASHFLALHQLNLGAVEVDAVFAVNRALADVQFAGEHHLAAGLERRRCLINQPRLNKKPEANRENGDPPAALQERLVTMEPGDERGAPGSGSGPIGSSRSRRVHD